MTRVTESFNIGIRTLPSLTFMVAAGIIGFILACIFVFYLNMPLVHGTVPDWVLSHDGMDRGK